MKRKLRIDAENVKQATTYKNIQTNIPPYVGNYKFYKITVQFVSRPYNVITDAGVVLLLNIITITS